MRSISDFIVSYTLDSPLIRPVASPFAVYRTARMVSGSHNCRILFMIILSLFWISTLLGNLGIITKNVS